MNKYLFSYSDEDIRKLVLRCYGRTKAYVMKTTGISDSEADDMLQESLLKLLDKKPMVLQSKIDGYFFSMVKNACINYRTRHVKTLSLDAMEIETALNLISEVDFDDAEIKKDSRPDVHHILKFADKLAPRTSEIFKLSRIEGKTHEEIAKELGISVRSVEKHLQKSVSEYRNKFLA